MADLSRPAAKRRRISSSAADMQSAITQPGSIKINVAGAYIIDHEDSDDESLNNHSNKGNSPSNSSSSNSGSNSPLSLEDSLAGNSISTGSNKPDLEETSYRYHKRDIRLPNHNAVVSHVAADIGGSLAKVVYFSREKKKKSPPASQAPRNDHLPATPDEDVMVEDDIAVDGDQDGDDTDGGRLHFVSFETDKIDECIEYLRALQTRQNSNPKQQLLSVQATGGGAYKFYDRIRERLGVDVQREDEMECLIVGLDFFITKIPSEVFTYDETRRPPESEVVEYQEPRSDPYPYLLVNIGSGVSMIKVSGPSQFQRIGGTSLGGGTLWGLLSLLTGARNFDDMLAMADRGENSSVDLLVGDIYGEGMGYEKIGLSERTIASSFGKVLKRKREAERRAEDGGGLSNGDGENHRSKSVDMDDEQGGSRLIGDGRMFKPEDISRSLLYAISNNIGQIAYLQSEKHNLQRIYFGGSFIRGHQQTIHTLSFAIKFWSKGSKQAYFLRHEGYLGAVGAFIRSKPVKWGRSGSVDMDH